MSETKYFVKKVQTCPTCEGKQFVQHPAWAEYWKENYNKPAMTREEDRKWFQDHGWYPSSSLDMRTDGTPDEEIVCSECEGEGELISEIDLVTAFIEILPPHLKDELAKAKTELVEVLNRGAVKA